MLVQMSNQPITWQRLNAFRHVDNRQDDLLKFKASAWARKLTLVTLIVVVAARWAGLSISETADLLFIA